MNIQSFIFTWNQFTSNAIDIESKLTKYGKTTIINSNINEKRDGWINLNDGYFAEQWNTLVSNIKPDVDFIFHIQADVSINDFDNLFTRFYQVSSKYDVGIYAPNIDYTYHKYDVTLLNKLESNLYEVPNTDCTCWFINRNVIDDNMIFDINTNVYGYGADWYYSTQSSLQNKHVLRDYSIKVDHPNYKNYNAEKANECFAVWFEEQSDSVKKPMRELMKKYYSCLIIT
jgi:hypothetical protein